MTDTTPNAAVSKPDWQTDCPWTLHHIKSSQKIQIVCA